MNDLIEALQDWYARQCNDTWEHSFGVEISNIDNPGWKIKITGASKRSILNTRIDRNETDWININADDTSFNAYGGPPNLQELLEAAVNWVHTAKNPDE
ncbi:Imm53 family immunity protein [Pseudomonas entomophila]|uniref:Immunity protein 53 of polymorphic toxin system n=2 Tax=Pseudomonas entomophila TaxID=312306 RepID=Q1ICN4_PSEE4|nr:Imm53 family immunity protein [Pseudomonas entomophila]WMW04615.1 Imm53 family immunity protein [Pseudomonas entomophila]CAK14579.1 hypothetical protein PSEEN1732 [Pseudomonas entomophila L48]